MQQEEDNYVESVNAYTNSMNQAQKVYDDMLDQLQQKNQLIQNFTQTHEDLMQLVQNLEEQLHQAKDVQNELENQLQAEKTRADDLEKAFNVSQKDFIRSSMSFTEKIQLLQD